MPVICEASFGKLVSSSLYWGSQGSRISVLSVMRHLFFICNLVNNPLNCRLSISLLGCNYYMNTNLSKIRQHFV